jgi:hypothetical protein
MKREETCYLRFLYLGSVPAWQQKGNENLIYSNESGEIPARRTAPGSERKYKCSRRLGKEMKRGTSVEQVNQFVP